MARERRKDAATATTGAAMLAAGGKMRQVGVARSGGPASRLGSITVLRGSNGRAKALYGGGTLLGLTGAAPLGVGAQRLVNPRREQLVTSAKRDGSFVRDGLQGSSEVLLQQAKDSRQPVPARVRAAQAATALGVGAGGGKLAANALKNVPRAKPYLTPIAGALAATASLPATNKIVRRQGYEITPTGAKRVKSTPKRPSSKASQARPMPRSLQADVAKFESYAQQRATITGAAGVPFAGPVLAASASRRFAAPPDKNKATARQLAVPVAGLAAGVGGAYGGAALASRSERAEAVARGGLDRVSGLENRLRAKVGMKEGSAVQRAVGQLNASKLKATRPLTRSKAALAGAVAGGLGAKALTNATGTQTAITLNQRDQKRWKQGVAKLDTGQSKRQQHRAAQQKKLNAAISTGTGLGSVGSLGLLLAGRKDAALKTGLGLQAVGGANSVLYGRVARREAKAADPYDRSLVKKREVIEEIKGESIEDFARRLREAGLKMRPMPKTTIKPLRTSRTLARVKAMDAESRERYFATKSGRAWMRRNGLGRAGTLSWGPTQPTPDWRARQGFGMPRKAGSTGYRGTGRPYGVAKADNGADHKDLIRRYGDRGPLPKGLDRDTKIRAYEARYAAHGGHKGEKWQRRANVAEGTRNAGLAGATLAGAAYVGARTRLGARMPALHNAALRRKADTAAVTSATVGGGAELYGEYARNRRASYSSSPGGVAASALTRLRANTPKENR